jgi:hypothetical protein
MVVLGVTPLPILRLRPIVILGRRAIVILGLDPRISTGRYPADPSRSRVARYIQSGYDANQRTQTIKYLLIHGAMIWSQRVRRDMVLA